jgi:hypothetical protein
MPKGDEHGIASRVVSQFIDESASDEDPEATVAKPELFTDFKVADRIFFMSGMGKILPIEPGPLIGHG